MDTELKNLIRATDKALDKLTREIADRLLENNPEDYNPRWCSYGSFNNGAGWSECGGEYEYDERKAREDALDEIIEDVESKRGEYFYDLLEDDDFRNALIKLVRNRWI